MPRLRAIETAVGDALAQGIFTAYGRAREDLDSFTKVVRPLMAIPVDYWGKEKGSILWYSTELQDYSRHTAKREGWRDPNYYDLQFDRAAVIALWPPVSSSGPDISYVADDVEIALTRAFGAKRDGTPTITKHSRNANYHAFENAMIQLFPNDFPSHVNPGDGKNALIEHVHKTRIQDGTPKARQLTVRTIERYLKKWRER